MEEMAWGQLQSGPPGVTFQDTGHLFNPMSLILFIYFYLYFMHTLCQIFVGLQDTKSTAAVVKLFIKFLSCSLFYSLAFNKIIFLLCSAYQISCKSATHFFMSQQKWRTFCRQLCNIMSSIDGKQNKMSLIVYLRLMAVFLNAATHIQKLSCLIYMSCKAQQCSCSV